MNEKYVKLNDNGQPNDGHNGLMLIRKKEDKCWLLGNPRSMAADSWDNDGWGGGAARVVPPNHFHLELKSEGSLLNPILIIT